jgi:hypothetical protein
MSHRKPESAQVQKNKYNLGKEFGGNRGPVASDALVHAIGELAVRASVISAASEFPMPGAVERLRQDYLDLVLLTYKHSLPTRAADRKKLAKTGELMKAMLETTKGQPTAVPAGRAQQHR